MGFALDGWEFIEDCFSHFSKLKPSQFEVAALLGEFENSNGYWTTLFCFCFLFGDLMWWLWIFLKAVKLSEYMFLFDDKFLLFRFLLILLSPKLKVVRIFGCIDRWFEHDFPRINFISIIPLLGSWILYLVIMLEFGKCTNAF